MAHTRGRKANERRLPQPWRCAKGVHAFDGDVTCWDCGADRMDIEGGLDEDTRTRGLRDTMTRNTSNVIQERGEFYGLTFNQWTAYCGGCNEHSEHFANRAFALGWADSHSHA